MTTNHVHEIVDNVSHALDTAKDDHEQVTALEKLQDDVKQDMQGMTADQVRHYVPQLARELEDHNQLPVLALTFAEQLGGNLSESDLRSEMRSANRAQRDGDNSRQLDKVFLQYLSDNYDKGSHLIATHNDTWYWKDSNISQADITDKLAEFRQERDDRHRKDSSQEKAGDVAETLLAGGENSLFNFIDRDGKNGRVNKSELQKYLDDAVESGSNNGQFAPEKQDAVKELLSGWDDENNGEWLRGGYLDEDYIADSLTKEGLVQAAGKNSQAELFAGREAKREQSIAVEAAASSQPGTNVQERNRPETSTAGAADTDRPGNREKTGTPAESEEQTGKAEQSKEPEPVLMEVKKGDSYWRMANRLLGDDATAGEILEKMKELQELNDNKPLIFFPGHPQTIKVPAPESEPAASSATDSKLKLAPGQLQA